MKLTESEVKELVKAALREAFINEGFMIKENVTETVSIHPTTKAVGFLETVFVN